VKVSFLLLSEKETADVFDHSLESKLQAFGTFRELVRAETTFENPLKSSQNYPTPFWKGTKGKDIEEHCVERR
jgi:hypothetical protein